MSTIDLSRHATDPRKRYAGVRMQQGRVLTDDDFNEAAILDAEDMRRTRVHAIGAYGTPDAGFLPTNLGVTDGRLDFSLSAGTLYLGGLRVEMISPERYLLQRDWLNFDTATAPAPPAEGQTRTDMVWLEAWQQPVTAVEDSELFEVALGGPDTSTRWRTLRRVHVSSGVGAGECGDAWAEVTAGFAALGSLTDEMELATDARLTVTFSAPAGSGDLCAPSQAGGYLGAENQAIRVQMVSATHYTWGFDNAAPLYRVQASARNGQTVVLRLLNQPKDAVHWPLRDQVVEILPWSAALANGERVAELRGHLSKVAVSYNADDQTLEIATALPANFGAQWQSRSDVAEFFDGSPDQNFFFMRVWQRGDDLDSPAAIPIGTPDLGHTGLRVAFSGLLRTADHWIVAARPAAPDQVVPWQLSLPSGAPPAGVRRYRAPIALIAWTTLGGITTGTVVGDCRPPFLPLTRIRGCCSVTVGDGMHSFGTYSRIQAAVDALPPSGGTVCILPGRYEEAVRVVGRRNVTLHGCGPRSRIVAPDEQGPASTALSIEGSTDVAVEALALEGGSGPVVEVRGSSALRIEACLLQFRDDLQRASAWPALFVDAQAVEIAGNLIEPLPAKLPEDLHRIFHHTAETLRAPKADAARGGIQLAGGCEAVRVTGNLIVGGTGNGITLGSILRFDRDNPNGVDLPDIDLVDVCAPCDPVDGGPPTDDPDGIVRYDSGGDLYDIEIARNEILRQGANGIAVVRFFGFSDKSDVILVTVHGLSIVDNRIVACLRRLVAQAPTAVQLMLGYGGISLAFVIRLEIAGNLIARNGRDWLTPVCGVFALVALSLRIEHNRICANGVATAEPPSAAQPGVRAGVHIWLALSDVPGSAKAPQSAALVGAIDQRARQAGQLRIHANQIEQPLGRALFLMGAGPMLITDNRLLSEGGGVRGGDPLATTVMVANFGMSREWTTELLAVFAALLIAKMSGKDTSEQCTQAKLAQFFPGIWPALPTGKLMFNDNQVSFLMRDAPAGLDLASALLVSLDDVGACDNQFEHHAQQRLVLADLLVLASTARSNDNRLAETWGRAMRSVLSFAVMNTAADNQSTHCISANGLQRAVHDNLTLAEAFCPDLCSDQKGLFEQMALGGQMAYTSG